MAYIWIAIEKSMQGKRALLFKSKPFISESYKPNPSKSGKWDGFPLGWMDNFKTDLEIGECGRFALVFDNLKTQGKMYRCEDCNVFTAYIEGEERHPNNCVNFLCNDDVCPHEEEINKLLDPPSGMIKKNDKDKDS